MKFMIIALGILFITCSTSNKIQFDIETFLYQRNLWTKSKPDNYQYDFLSYNDGLVKNIMTHVNIEGKICISSNTDYYFSEFYGGDTGSLGIDDVYTFIENEYEKYRDSNGPVYLSEIKIIYNTLLHVPNEIYMFYFSKQNASDIITFRKIIICNFSIP
jgi:hypothetical protein